MRSDKRKFPILIDFPLFRLTPGIRHATSTQLKLLHRSTLLAEVEIKIRLCIKLDLESEIHKNKKIFSWNMKRQAKFHANCITADTLSGDDLSFDRRAAEKSIKRRRMLINDNLWMYCELRIFQPRKVSIEAIIATAIGVATGNLHERPMTVMQISESFSCEKSIRNCDGKQTNFAQSTVLSKLRTFDHFIKSLALQTHRALIIESTADCSNAKQEFLSAIFDIFFASEKTSLRLFSLQFFFLLFAYWIHPGRTAGKLCKTVLKGM